MLFFRDEEQIGRWCEAHDVRRGPGVTLGQLWKLSMLWYSNRLDPDPPRRTPAEMREIFRSAGLDGVFWDPEARER